jgi:predicted DCC family thiol-disulfide oxidoreductase YuxK
MMDPKKYSRTVIFDGDCGFCQRSIRVGRNLDWLKKIEWRTRLEPGLESSFPQVSLEESLHRMFSVRPDGKTYGGFYAVRDVVRYFPLTFLPAMLLYIPGASWIGVPVYDWIAKNRHRFGGKSSGSCTAPEKK